MSKISAYPAASALDGTEVFPLDQGGTTKKATAAQIVAQRVLAQSAVAVPLTGSTSETTLATITLPAGAMGANGQIEIEALFSTTNSANTKTLRFKFGGSTIHSIAFTTTAGAQMRKRLSNRNSASSQVAANASAQIDFNTSTSTNFGAPATYAVDTSAAVTILITGQLANSGETITLESYRILLFPKA